MPMAYAIVQKELVVPGVDQLKRAFSVSPLLTGLDAQTSANDAYGILLRGVPADEANALQDALQREGIETELVEESKLPVAPPSKIARQAEFHPSHLTLYDPMKRASEVPWNEIMLIAAGYVRIREVRKHRGALEEAAPREEEHDHMLLEIFLNGGL